MGPMRLCFAARATLFAATLALFACDSESEPIEPACTAGEVVDCYTGTEATFGEGTCRSGTRTCRDDGSGFDECTGEILPQAEDCATPLDESCDGAPNDGCPCEPGSTAACYSGAEATVGHGICVAGEQTCSASGLGFGACTGEVLPAEEDCATPADDDCDGEVNEPDAGCLCEPGEQISCYSGPPNTAGVGTCLGGLATCLPSGVGFGACEGEELPASEDCGTPEDEDCDGISNGPDAGCTCAPGAIVPCYSGPSGTVEVGTCAYGENVCEETGLGFGACEGDVTPTVEDCATPDDEDCDGEANQPSAGCECTPSESEACYPGPPATLGVGQCTAGTRTCNGGGQWAPCTGEVLPSVEDCAIDEDENCDGLVNEGCPCPAETVQTLASENCATDYGETLWRVEIPDWITKMFTLPDGSVVGIMRRYAAAPGYQAITPGAFPSALVGKWDNTGTLIWGREAYGFGTPDANPSFELGPAADGGFAMGMPAGNFAATAFGASPITTLSDGALRVLYSISPDGDALFAVEPPITHQFETNTIPYAVAGLPGGGLVYAISFYGLLIQGYDATGALAWEHSLPAVDSDRIELASAPDGSVIVAFSSNDPVDFGAGPIPENPPANVPDLLVVRFDQDGNQIWGVRPQSGGYIFSMRVHDGVIAIGEENHFVRLSLSDGALLSSQTVPSFLSSRPHGIVGNDALLYGDFYSPGPKDFGLGPLAPYSGSSGTMFAFREGTQPRFARAPLVSHLGSLAGDAPDTLYASFLVQGAFDLDGVPENAAVRTTYLARLAR